MISAYNVAIISAGIFFLNGLLTGVWKYRQIVSSENAMAHPYVDIAHRASLLYSFAAILLSVFVEISQLPAGIELLAVSLLILYFTAAIMSYMMLGFSQQTDNQFAHPRRGLTVAMWSLIVAETGGFLVLFYGVLIEMLQ